MSDLRYIKTYVIKIQIIKSWLCCPLAILYGISFPIGEVVATKMMFAWPKDQREHP